MINEIEVNWRSHVPRLFEEIITCSGTDIFGKPLVITLDILREVAERCIEINDPKLNALMCRLALYQQADPYSDNYDKEMTEKVIAEGNTND